jgi:hypothetical protein
MDCRHNILVNNKYLWVLINTKGDCRVSQISWQEWVGLWRYEIGFIHKPCGGRRFWINEDGKTGLKIHNALYRLRMSIKCFFGKHHAFVGTSECHHCKKPVRT